MYRAPHKQAALNNSRTVNSALSLPGLSHCSRCIWLITNEALCFDLEAKVKGGSIQSQALSACLGTNSRS